MSLPTLNGTARLIDDPELRFSAGSGKAVVKVRLAFNSRRKDQSGEWVDADSFFIDGKAFDKAAENIAESLFRGIEVVVSGRLKTEKWETREGEKRSAPTLLIDSIGPSLRNATATVTKAGGQGKGQQANGQARQGREDPWASSGAAAQQSGGWSDEAPPF